MVVRQQQQACRPCPSATSTKRSSGGCVMSKRRLRSCACNRSSAARLLAASPKGLSPSTAAPTLPQRPPGLAAGSPLMTNGNPQIGVPRPGDARLRPVALPRRAARPDRGHLAPCKGPARLIVDDVEQEAGLQRGQGPDVFDVRRIRAPSKRRRESLSISLWERETRVRSEGVRPPASGLSAYLTSVVRARNQSCARSCTAASSSTPCAQLQFAISRAPSASSSVSALTSSVCRSAIAGSPPPPSATASGAIDQAPPSPLANRPR